MLETCRAVSDEHGARLIAGAGTMGTGKAVLCGDDACIYPMLQLGASGGVAACACLAPGAYAANPGCARRCGRRTPDRSARPWPPTAPCPRF